MPDFDAMYKTLFNAMTQAITILQEAQEETEEIYISSEPVTIKVLHGNSKQHENLSGGDSQREKYDKDSLRKIIGENIQALRLKHSMSIEELSEKMGITLGYLGLLERRRRSVTADNLGCLSNIFNIPIDDLFRPLNLETKEISEISAT